MRESWDSLLQAALAFTLGVFACNSAAADSVAYQINPAHTGAIDFPQGFELPLRPIWSRDLRHRVSYPIVVQGRVFVTTRRSPGSVSGAALFALDAATGGMLWSKRIPNQYWAAATYTQGRLFVITTGGLLLALDPETGSEIWARQIPHAYPFDTPPTASEGMVYLNGGDTGYSLYAISGGDGNVVWKGRVDNGNSPPAVSADGVFVASGCRARQFDAVTGILRWSSNSPCAGINATAVFYSDRLHAATQVDNSKSAVAFSSFDGGIVSKTRGVVTTPAFRGGVGYFPGLNGVSARSVRTGAELWRMDGPGYLALPPIVVNGKVLVAYESGRLVVVDGLSGSNLQSLALGKRIPAAHAESYTRQHFGLGAGAGMLFVPAGNHLIALRGIAP
jgi:outer membrane protein assembly factor BamB